MVKDNEKWLLSKCLLCSHLHQFQEDPYEDNGDWVATKGAYCELNCGICRFKPRSPEAY